MRAGFARYQASWLFVWVKVAVTDNVDRAIHDLAAIRLYRIAIRRCVRNDPGGGIAMGLMCRRPLFGLRRAVRAILFRDRSDSTRLHRKTHPQSGEQAEKSGPAASVVVLDGSSEHAVLILFRNNRKRMLPIIPFVSSRKSVFTVLSTSCDRRTNSKFTFSSILPVPRFHPRLTGLVTQ